MASKEEILDSISKMSVMDLVDLVKLMEEKFGVTAAAPVAVAAAPAGGAAAPAAEEKTEFTVVLAAAGEKKIEVIKEVRAHTGLGVKEGVNKDEAGKIKATLEKVGAKVELK